MVGAVALLFLLGSAQAQSSKPGEAPVKYRLSQKDVAELVLKQGPETSEVNDRYLQTRVLQSNVLRTFDWTATVQSGYEFDKEENLTRSAMQGNTYRLLENTALLSKPFTTGTLLTFGYNQYDHRIDYNLTGAVTTPLVTKATENEFGVTVEQSLLNNSFGRASRAIVESAEKTFAAETVTRANSLETVVLNAIRQYWTAYVAEQTFKESLAARDRLKNLVAQVKRKNSVGYANPGELPQSQANFEKQEQSVKFYSTDYLKQLDQLNVLLALPLSTPIEFVVDGTVPAVPKLADVQVENLRQVRAQKLRTESSEADLRAAQSNSYPAVNLVGRYYSSGYDETSDGAYSHLTSGTHPKYYAGVKFVYNFGSDAQNEDILNRRVSRDLQQTQLTVQRVQSQANLAQVERNVQSTYAILQSALRQKDFRERAVNELTRTFSQGRTDIKTLIDAINDQFDTELILSRSVGNYQIALNEWAAARDELIPEEKK